MPMSAIPVIVTSLAFLKSMYLNGPHPLVGSRPIQKLRVTDISGIIAKSWYTVAMSASMASRGLSKVTGRPPMRICPLVGL